MLTLQETASRLAISEATLRNWVKRGKITPHQTHPLRFSAETLIAIRQTDRLTQRANKKYSKSKLPAKRPFHESVKSFHSLRLSLNTAMHAVVLKQLEQSGEAEIQPDHSVCFLRQSIAEMLADPGIRIDERFFRFYEKLPNPDVSDDYFGEAYQALTSIGRKSRDGSYYTPSGLIDSSLQYGVGTKNFLDPCCGTGRYLVRAAKLLHLPPEQIFGIDRDPIAVKLAAVNLLLAFPGKEFKPNILRGNTLTNRTFKSHDGKFEFAATNPPWGAEGRGKEESFSLFLRRTKQFLVPGGKFSFLLPESALNVRSHTSLRQHLVESCTVQKITLLGRQFSGVFTDVLRLDARNLPPPPGHSFEIVRKEGTEKHIQQEIGERGDWAIETTLTTPERELLRKVFQRKDLPTLAGNADWALGIVTGDNDYFLTEQPEPGTEPILRGNDIFPGRIAPPRYYLRPGIYQQAAPMNIYRSKNKLLYRFIANHPIIAVDRAGSLTLNSANLLFPKLPGYTPEQLAEVLNSPLYGFLYRKRFNCRKILRKDLESLPFPPAFPPETKDVEKFLEDFFLLTDLERALVRS